MTQQHMIITIDGPTASGKSTIASSLADKLGMCHINSGYLFRSLAYIFLREGIAITDAAQHMTIAALEAYVAPKQFEYQYDAEHGVRVYFQGKNIAPELKTEAIDNATSLLSVSAAVRAVVLSLQRDLALRGPVIVDGRDAGAVVFPQAPYKFYLTASLAVRATRWMHDQARKGHLFTLEQAQAIVAERDRRDTQRELSPLRIADGAVIVDNSDMDLQQTLDAMLAVIAQK